MTSNYLKKIMKDSNIKAKNFSDFMRLFALYVTVSAVATPLGAGFMGAAGSLVGEGIGTVVGSVVPGVGTEVGAAGGAQVGATLGVILGGAFFLTASVKGACDDCNQQ